MAESRTYKNPAGSRHKKHTSVLDYDALDQWRFRHGMMKTALMDAERLLKGRRKDKVTEALELIATALQIDKKINV